MSVVGRSLKNRKQKNNLKKGFALIVLSCKHHVFSDLFNQVADQVWATSLALIWLNDVKLDAKEEWNILAKKAMSWLQANNSKYPQYLVSCNVFFLFVSVQD